MTSLSQIDPHLPLSIEMRMAGPFIAIKDLALAIYHVALAIFAGIPLWVIGAIGEEEKADFFMTSHFELAGRAFEEGLGRFVSLFHEATGRELIARAERMEEPKMNDLTLRYNTLKKDKTMRPESKIDLVGNTIQDLAETTKAVKTKIKNQLCDQFGEDVIEKLVSVPKQFRNQIDLDHATTEGNELCTLIFGSDEEFLNLSLAVAAANENTFLLFLDRFKLIQPQGILASFEGVDKTQLCLTHFKNLDMRQFESYRDVILENDFLLSVDQLRCLPWDSLTESELDALGQSFWFSESNEEFLARLGTMPKEILNECLGRSPQLRIALNDAEKDYSSLSDKEFKQVTLAEICELEIDKKKVIAEKINTLSGLTGCTAAALTYVATKNKEDGEKICIEHLCIPLLYRAFFFPFIRCPSKLRGSGSIQEFLNKVELTETMQFVEAITAFALLFTQEELKEYLQKLPQDIYATLMKEKSLPKKVGKLCEKALPVHRESPSSHQKSNDKSGVTQ